MMIIIGIAVGVYGVIFAWKRFWTYRAQVYNVKTVLEPTPDDLEAGGAEPYVIKNYFNLHTVPDADPDSDSDTVLGKLVLNLNTVSGNSDDDGSNCSWTSVSDLELSDDEEIPDDERPDIQAEPIYKVVMSRNQRCKFHFKP